MNNEIEKDELLLENINKLKNKDYFKKHIEVNSKMFTYGIFSGLFGIVIIIVAIYFRFINEISSNEDLIGVIGLGIVFIIVTVITSIIHKITYNKQIDELHSKFMNNHSLKATEVFLIDNSFYLSSSDPIENMKLKELIENNEIKVNALSTQFEFAKRQKEIDKILKKQYGFKAKLNNPLILNKGSQKYFFKHNSSTYMIMFDDTHYIFSDL